VFAQYASYSAPKVALSSGSSWTRTARLKTKTHHRRVPEEDDVPEEQRLPDDDRREGQVNRVPHVPVHASHHQVTRRGHGCGRPQPVTAVPVELLQSLVVRESFRISI
jgi:hypothetical protein